MAFALVLLVLLLTFALSFCSQVSFTSMSSGSLPRPPRKRKRSRTIALEVRDDVSVLMEQVKTNVRLIQMLGEVQRTQQEFLADMRKQLQAVVTALRELLSTLPDDLC